VEHPQGQHRETQEAQVTEVKQDPRRPRGYIWVTWLTKLLAGEDKCWYRAWHKTNHKYEKTPDDPEREAFFKEWTAKHDKLVNRRAEALKEKGYVVRLEDEGAFKLVGQKADLAGKPDIVAIAGDHAIVIDGKSGKRRKSDHWQVWIYLFALPLSWMRGTKLELKGQIEYSDSTEDIKPLDTATRNAIVNAINKIASPDPPDASPSSKECQWCDIANCPYRVKDAAVPEGDATRFF
jgi:hypothetical protein